MPKPLFTLLKLILIAFYILAAVAQVTDILAGYSQILLWIVGVLAVAHLGEYVLMFKRINSLPAEAPGHFLGTLLFGFVYWLPLLKAQPAEA